jgi:hypothetical protein
MRFFPKALHYCVAAICIVGLGRIEAAEPAVKSFDDRLRAAIRHDRQQEVVGLLEERAFSGKLSEFVQFAQNVEMVRILLSAGADLTYKDPSGMNLLHIAIQNGFRDVVLYLLDAGFDVNAKDHWGRTPLHHSAGTIGSGMALFLLQRGAYKDCQDSKGTTALMNAAEEGNVEAFELLLKMGASVQLRNSAEETVVEMVGRMKPSHLLGTEAIERMRNILRSAGARL